MSLKVVLEDQETSATAELAVNTQVTVYLQWVKGDKVYNISQLTLTHNPEYPTPAVSMIAPHAGIPLRVYNSDGDTLLDTRKPRKPTTEG